VFINGDYAYVADTGSLQIIDINPPESAAAFSSVGNLQWAMNVRVKDNYAYVAGSSGGLYIVKLW